MLSERNKELFRGESTFDKSLNIVLYSPEYDDKYCFWKYLPKFDKCSP